MFRQNWQNWQKNWQNWQKNWQNWQKNWQKMLKAPAPLPTCTNERGAVLIGAIVAISLLTGLGILMLISTVQLHHYQKESLAGTQLQLVTGAILYQRVTSQNFQPGEETYHLTRDGIYPAHQTVPPDAEWIDTITVTFRPEWQSGSIRLWALAQSQRSRRGAMAVHYQMLPPNSPSPQYPNQTHHADAFRSLDNLHSLRTKP